MISSHPLTRINLLKRIVPLGIVLMLFFQKMTSPMLPSPDRIKVLGVEEAASFNVEVQMLQMTAETYLPPTKVKDQFLTDLVLNQTLGSKTHAACVKKLCPEVIEHYNKLPVIKELVNFKGREFPKGTTDYLARAICSLTMVQ
jgi:hypothetical protein